MSGKPKVLRVLYAARDMVFRDLFRALRQYCRGDVLDVGGWDFYLTAKQRKIGFDTWTTLECSEGKKPQIPDEKFKFVTGDGCNMQFADNSFDTAINIHVLEHVFEPIRMVLEIGRILKKGGRAVFLIPQNSALHCVPHHYYNFTRFWIEQVMATAGLRIIELEPLGGFWSSLAARFFHFFLQSFKYGYMSTADNRRNVFFYIFYPVMFLYALLSIPLNLMLSFGDLREEPNSHLVVAEKN